MNYCLDSSFCGAFIMPDERSDKITRFFEDIDEDSALYVPALFWFEISNLITSAIRRRRINSSDIYGLMELLPQSKFDTDFSYGSVYAASVTALAVEYSLSSYDSAYLELAIRRDAVVGTLDDNLAKACIMAGLRTI